MQIEAHVQIQLQILFVSLPLSLSPSLSPSEIILMSKFLITQPLAEELEFVFKNFAQFLLAGRGHSPFEYTLCVCVCVWESNVLFYRRNSVLLSTIRFFCAVCLNMVATCVPFFIFSAFWKIFILISHSFIFFFIYFVSFFFLLTDQICWAYAYAPFDLSGLRSAGVAQFMRIGSGLGDKWEAFHASAI